MNPTLPSVNPQYQRDTDHLNLLGVFHFVCAGLGLLGMGFIVMHYFIMHTVFTNPELTKNGANPPPLQIFEMLRVVYLVVGVFILAGMVLNVMSGLFLRQRRNRGFSIFVAALNCLHIPLGTTLGVFTIIVLMRDSVRESYEAGQN